jgi:hypothetical protein
MFSQIDVVFKITIESKLNNNFKSYINLEITQRRHGMPFSITPPHIKQYPNLRQKSAQKKKKKKKKKKHAKFL